MSAAGGNAYNGEQSLFLSGLELHLFPEYLLTTEMDSKNIIKLDNLRQLDLSCNQLQALPLNLHTQLGGLRHLDLSDNQLADIPSGVTFPANLETLLLNGNLLTEFPIVRPMESLTNLSLAGNKISTLPDNLPELLPNLTSLSLGANLLTELPEGFLFPPQLRVLYLAGNSLTSLPSSMGLLSKLKVLSVHDNRLQTLPASFVNLVDLEVLNLHMNQISILPVELVGLRKLRQLSARQNPLVSNFAEAIHKQVPTLRELSGRVIKKQNIRYAHEALPAELKNFLDTSRHCLGCGGAYFDSHCVGHVEFIDMCGSYHVPFIQYICSSKCKEDSSIPQPRTKLAKLRKVLLDKYNPALSPPVEVLEKEIARAEESDDFD